MRRAVGVGSYPVSPEKLRICVHIDFGSAGQVIYHSGENILNTMNKKRVGGRGEALTDRMD